MNEQRQAELLATWLAGEAPGTPEGTDLDAEAVETILALRPELAPAARVTAEDILATVASGPLAAPGMPTNASTAELPATPKASNRPWLLAFLGAGGVSAVVATAAAVMITALVFTSSRSAPDLQAYEAAAPAAQMSAPRDTGTPGGAEVRQPARRRPMMAARPSPMPRPRPRPAAKRKAETTADGPADDAVAFADEEYAFDDADDGFRDEGQARKDRAQQVLIPEMARSAAGGSPSEPGALDVATRPIGGLGSGEGARPAAPPPPPPAMAAPSAKERPPSDGASSRDRAYGGPVAAEAKEAEEAELSSEDDAEPASDLSSATVRRAHRGVGDVTSPAIEQVVQALAAGRPDQARTLATQALTVTTDLAQRQRLYALRGDADTALGDIAAARAAYDAADGIRQQR